jgi:hypothetical protein
LFRSFGFRTSSADAYGAFLEGVKGVSWQCGGKKKRNNNRGEKKDSQNARIRQPAQCGEKAAGPYLLGCFFSRYRISFSCKPGSNTADSAEYQAA